MPGPLPTLSLSLVCPLPLLLPALNKLSHSPGLFHGKRETSVSHMHPEARHQNQASVRRAVVKARCSVCVCECLLPLVQQENLGV